MKDEFDELLELEQENQDSKKIKRKMNIYLYKRMSLFFIIIALILSATFVLTKPIEEEKSYYINPLEFKIEDLDNQTSLQVLLSSFYHTQYSGVELMFNEVKQVEDDHYEFDIQEISHFFHVNIGNNQEKTTIDLNKDVGTFNHMFSIQGYEYRNVVNKEYDIDYDLSDEIKDLEDLPDSSILEVAVSFNKQMSSKELTAFMKKYPDVHFVWACTGIDNWQGAYGINLQKMIIPDTTNQLIDKYPYLVEFDQYDSSQLEQHYLSSLQVLIDYPELSDLLMNGKNLSITLKEQYDNVKDNMSFIGVKCYIKKDDLIKGIKNGDFQLGMIEDIRYSKYERG